MKVFVSDQIDSLPLVWRLACTVSIDLSLWLVTSWFTFSDLYLLSEGSIISSLNLFFLVVQWLRIFNSSLRLTTLEFFSVLRLPSFHRIFVSFFNFFLLADKLFSDLLWGQSSYYILKLAGNRRAKKQKVNILFQIWCRSSVNQTGAAYYHLQAGQFLV